MPFGYVRRRPQVMVVPPPVVIVERDDLLQEVVEAELAEEIVEDIFSHERYRDDDGDYSGYGGDLDDDFS